MFLTYSLSPFISLIVSTISLAFLLSLSISLSFLTYSVILSIYFYNPYFHLLLLLLSFSPSLSIFNLSCHLSLPLFLSLYLLFPLNFQMCRNWVFPNAQHFIHWKFFTFYSYKLVKIFNQLLW